MYTHLYNWLAYSGVRDNSSPSNWPICRHLIPQASRSRPLLWVDLYACRCGRGILTIGKDPSILWRSTVWPAPYTIIQQTTRTLFSEGYEVSACLCSRGGKGSWHCVYPHCGCSLWRYMVFDDDGQRLCSDWFVPLSTQFESNFELIQGQMFEINCCDE